MKNWFTNLKFRFLLVALVILIRVTTLRSVELREKLLEKDIAVVMKCKDGRIARTIRCTWGKVRSQKGLAGDVISSITWLSPAVGSRVMMKMVKGDPKALTKAVIAGELIPEGNAAGIRWFLDVVSLLSRFYNKNKKRRPASEERATPTAVPERPNERPARGKETTPS